MPILSAILLFSFLIINEVITPFLKLEKKIPIWIGILIAVVTIGSHFLFDSAFAASTPIHIKVRNQSDQDLKIYSIIFWNNELERKENFVEFHNNLKITLNTDIWFEYDGASYYWIIGKSASGKIEYLQEFNDADSSPIIQMKSLQNIDTKKLSIANSLTEKKGREVRWTKIAILANFLLIGFLVVGKLRRNKLVVTQGKKEKRAD